MIRRVGVATPPQFPPNLWSERVAAVGGGSTVGVIDPHVPFEPGAIPVCSSDIPLVMSSVGATLCDHHGAKESLVARSVVERMGPQFVSQSVCDKKFGGEGGGGSAVHTTSISLARFTFTIQYAYLPARFNVAGAVPFPSEVGATIVVRKTVRKTLPREGSFPTLFDTFSPLQKKNIYIEDKGGQCFGNEGAGGRLEGSRRSEAGRHGGKGLRQ